MMNEYLRIGIELHLMLNAFLCGWQWKELKPKKFNNKIMWFACIVFFMLTFDLIYFGELAWLHMYDFFRIRRVEIRRQDDQVYMIRWSCTPFIKLHKFIRSDDSCHHDHPWWFISIVLRGSYYDVTTERREMHQAYMKMNGERSIDKWVKEIDVKKKMRAGRIMFRKPLHLHRVELETKELTCKITKGEQWQVIYKPCWTLVINGRDQREWGFMTRSGWVWWQDFFQRDKSRNACR